VRRLHVPRPPGVRSIRRGEHQPGANGTEPVSFAAPVPPPRKPGIRWPSRQRPEDFPAWPRRLPARIARRVLVTGIALPVARLFYDVKVRGRMHLRELEGPCLIISNHNMHMDQTMLLLAIPHRMRQRVSIAAAASDIYNTRFRGFWASLLGNAFPFAKAGSGVRESLEDTMRMLGEGWNVLLFPEGKLTVMGPMQPFKGGIGLLAAETGAQVLPMRVDVLRPGLREPGWFPNPRARVRVSIGRPVRVAKGTRYSEATATLERAVREA
jgi:1-acyl-sn-glycerol-3-phosphate acyltransferase